MSTRWYNEKKKEHFYKKAKKEGYRARSAFKLKQIQEKFSIIKKGDTVVDLGAAPGSWSQIAEEIVGDEGRVIGIDISPIKPPKNVEFIRGDMTKEDTLERLMESLNNKKVDAVLSDMSPDITGNYSVDHARSIYLCKKALNTADKILRKSGNFVCKAFDGEHLNNFLKEVKEVFSNVQQFSPPASRKRSSEIYIVAKKYLI